MLWVELQASRQQAAQIETGDVVTIAGCDKPGRITASGMQLEGTTQTVVVRAELPSAASCLRPNQFVEAIVKPQRVPEGMLQVPAGAVVRLDGKDHVFVREIGGFRPVPITLGANGSDTAMVGGALKPGAEVAARGVATLKGMWLGLGDGASEGK
jgi:multidrug efflux pump subunit AcrA (membrane-fusion protein)